eukprot:g33521.t1
MKFPEVLFIVACDFNQVNLEESAGNVDEHATTITDFISKCMEDCVPKKSIQVFLNRKPWKNQEIHCLLKTRCAAFKSDDPGLYRKSRYDLHKAIRDAMRRFTEDATSLGLHSSREHLDNKGTYISLLLFNYSSIFNFIIPDRLISKLQDIGLGSTLCNWILSFLTHTRRSVRI